MNHLLFVALFITTIVFPIHSQTQAITTQATITNIETRTSGRNTSSVALIDYVIESGDTISSQVHLYGLPFIGTFKSVGDTVTVIYQKDNPYLVQSTNRHFMQKYAWHIIIGITLLFYGYRFIKRKKTV